MEREIIEELIKHIQGKKKATTITSYATGYNHACDEIIEVIKLVTEVTKKS